MTLQAPPRPRRRPRWPRPPATRHARRRPIRRTRRLPLLRLTLLHWLRLLKRPRPLLRRHEVFRLRGRVQLLAADIGDHANDLRGPLHHPGDQHSADRVFTRKKPARERFVDDDDVRHARVVALIEVTART